MMYCENVYGAVLRIRLVYDKDFPSNRCYVTFLSCDEARLALEHVASLPLAGSGFKTELLHSRNVVDSDMDYIPNIFDNHLENSVPKRHQIPPSRWFVAYYRNGRGNFIHTSRYLAKEIGTIPEGNLKKYGTFPRYRLEQDILQLANRQFISLGSSCRELLYWQKDGTGASSYASLAARSSAESAGPKTTPSATSRSHSQGAVIHLANRFALLSDDSVESSEICDWNPPALTKVTHVVDVHSTPESPKPLKGLTKRHHSSAESTDMAQTPSVSDRASCDEDGLTMESSNDIVTAVPCGPTAVKSVVRPEPRPPVPVLLSAGRTVADPKISLQSTLPVFPGRILQRQVHVIARVWTLNPTVMTAWCHYGAAPAGRVP
ncbi:hypothetical protein E2C01_021849 [Portunus trituberculatus]|uniref:RRM domain-containing protein n=1 Tax=Portunus trituberculatus TaxID=210409 RepID=A0A5B7E3V5_PORTR|nr:hypothetical protein [Portunus trituberculatus]